MVKLLNNDKCVKNVKSGVEPYLYILMIILGSQKWHIDLFQSMEIFCSKFENVNNEQQA